MSLGLDHLDVVRDRGGPRVRPAAVHPTRLVLRQPAFQLRRDSNLWLPSDQRLRRQRRM